ncbi:hypothetical protein DM02DRAFT_559452 [Periconia macrospinosa]|uniref:VIT-domain-containing protein n=1 Tax=Periconia macrospinosa TaxID=97972 RepID=A0A2V1DZP2_9PLEO|nr:hypothetical protein DM02DRAFT_559452 [Periconia macrospinosa]
MSIFPGISFRYDPREPFPPEFLQVDAGTAIAPHRHPPNRLLCRSAGGKPPIETTSDTVWKEGEQVEGFLPPLSAAVKVQIVHDTANFVITHRFCNQSNVMLQGTYQFPLPLEATVTGFNCRVEPNKIIRGEVKAKEDARRDFENAVQNGRIGGLLEQQTADIFTTTLGNIPANTKMRAELSFVCLLKHRIQANEELFTLTLPTYIAPRYGAPPPGVKTSVEGPKSLSVQVDLLTTEKLVSISSDTHAIAVEKGSGQRPCQRWEDFASHDDEQVYDARVASIQLEGCTALDRDLILDVRTALSSDGEVPHACLEVHSTFKNHKAVMLTVPPEFMLQTETTDRNGEVIFVADRSGSMSDKMASLKSAMMFFINGIPYGRPFNIWCFGSSFTSMWTHSRPLSEESKNEATTYVQQQFDSNMGGTEILSALQAATQSRNPHAEMDVIVLTDGEVWRASDTIDFVKQTSQRSEGMVRFFSLGIGTAVSHELVEGIARAGGGYADIITSASHGGWEDRTVAVLKAALTGHIGSFQVELSWKEGSVADGLPAVEYEQSPINPSTMSPFVRNRLYLLFDCEDAKNDLEAIILKASGSNGAQVTKRINVIKLTQPDSTIHKLAARALLRDLEQGNSKFHAQKSSEYSLDLEQHVRNEAVKLGCKWSLVSMWTSLVAVEEVCDADNEIKKHHLGIATVSEKPWDQLFQSRKPLFAGARLNREILYSPLSLRSFRKAAGGFNFKTRCAPASPPLIPRSASCTEKTTEVKVAEDFIRTILPFQTANGKFIFQQVVAIEKQLGPSFMNVVSELAAERVDVDKAVTAAFIALLEKHFHNCQPLWQLMVRKANEYLTANCTEHGTLLQKARDLVESVEIAPGNMESKGADADTSIELEVAPVSQDVTPGSRRTQHQLPGPNRLEPAKFGM